MSDRDRRVGLVTGVSRRGGIGFAIATRLVKLGFDLVVAHHAAHDAEQPWGADDLAQVIDGIRSAAAPGGRVVDASCDLAGPDAAEWLMGFAVREFGHVDALVCNHARSGGDGCLLECTAAMLDAHWAVNARSSLLLAREFAAQHRGCPGADATGRIVFLTSGQELGPMPGEIAYATSKAAIAGITKTLAYELAPRGIAVNCVNPGPVDSDSYVTDELRTAVADRFPFGRWGEPDDPARLIAWLVSQDGRWVTGQVLNTEGGFVR
ncbi:MAG: 3-ketoacyl-ACP reductase [Micrococcales bacterium]|nr:MAG: 3-ketoacyl-ACP reductase [Micrococcales bacterium]